MPPVRIDVPEIQLTYHNALIRMVGNLTKAPDEVSYVYCMGLAVGSLSVTFRLQMEEVKQDLESLMAELKVPVEAKDDTPGDRAGA